jgi:hypothetical protein
VAVPYAGLNKMAEGINLALHVTESQSSLLLDTEHNKNPYALWMQREEEKASHGRILL